MKNNILDFTENKSILKKIIGTTLFLLGIMLCFKISFQAVFFIGIGVLLIKEKGFEFNKETQTFRIKHNYLFMTKGKWKKFEDFNYVTIFPTKESYSLNTFVNEAQLSSKVYVLNLFYDKNRKISIYKNPNLIEATEQAKIIANFLNIGLLDATDKHNKTWII